MPYCLQCGHPSDYKIPQGDEKPRLICPNCGYIHYENPKIICGTLAIHQDKILLCRRAIEPRYGYWTLPAGFMELGETTQEGALRETQEEAQAHAKNPQLYCLFNLPELGQVHLMYIADLAQGKFGVGNESLECALFAENEILWEELSFLTIHQTLKHYFADKKRFHKRTDFPIHQETILKDDTIIST